MDREDELEWASRAGALEPLVEACERASGAAARRFAIDRLERTLLVTDPGVASRWTDRLRALGVSPSVLEASQLALPPHAVHVPLVLRDPSGHARALVRAFIVSYEPSDEAHAALFGRTAERAARTGIVLAARDAPPGTAIDRLRLVPVQPAALEGVEIDGPSLGAASYLSARALFSGRRVRSGLAVTGALVGRAIGPVDGLDAKREACRARGLVLLASRGDVRADDDTCEGIDELEALVERALEPGASDADVEAEVRAARDRSGSGWNGYRWPSVRETIARTLVRVPDRRPDLRVEVLARLAAAERHLGRTRESLSCIARAEAILGTPVARIAVPDEPRVRLWRQKAMTLLQALSLRPARAAAKRSVAIARRARLRGELVPSLGAEGLCALASQRAHEAVALFEEALEHTLAHRPSDAARSRAYLVEALGHAGDARGAHKQYELALREAEDDARRGRDGKIEWVRTSYAEALVALGRSTEALAVLDHASVEGAIASAPLPGLRARRWLALATIASAASEREVQRGLSWLETSPDAYEALEPALRTTAHVNVLHALRHRMARGEVVSVERLEASLRALPPVPAIARLSAQIHASGGAPSAAALDLLLRTVARA